MDLNDPNVIKAISNNITSYIIIKEFEKTLGEIVIEHKKSELLSMNRFLSSTTPFPASKKILEAKKTIFNYTQFDLHQYLD